MSKINTISIENDIISKFTKSDKKKDRFKGEFDSFEDRYRSFLKDENFKIDKIETVENDSEYYLVSESGDKIEAMCPCCGDGIETSIFNCVNHKHEDHKFSFSLTHCKDYKNCNFLSSNPKNIFKAITDGEKKRVEKISNAASVKKDMIKELEEKINENSIVNIFKAIFKEKPIPLLFTASVLIFVMPVISYNLGFKNSSQVFKADLSSGSIEYNMHGSANELDFNYCFENFEKIKSSICN